MKHFFTFFALISFFSHTPFVKSASLDSGVSSKGHVNLAQSDEMSYARDLPVGGLSSDEAYQKAKEYYRLGLKHLENEQWKEAIKTYKEAFDICDKYDFIDSLAISISNSLGDIYVDIAGLSKKEALDIAPSFKSIPNRDFPFSTKAIRYYEKACEMLGYPNCQNNIKKEGKKVCNDLAGTLPIDFLAGEILIKLGKVSKDIGQSKKAEKAFKSAEDIYLIFLDRNISYMKNTDDKNKIVAAWKQLIIIYSQTGNKEKFDVTLKDKDILEWIKDDLRVYRFDLYHTLATSINDQRKSFKYCQEARNIYKAKVHKISKIIEILFQMVHIHIQQGKIVEALRLLKEIKEDYKDGYKGLYPLYHQYYMGRCYRELGKSRDAIKQVKGALEKSEKFAEVPLIFFSDCSEVLGLCYAKEELTQETEAEVKNELEIKKKLYGDDGVPPLLTYVKLSAIYESQGKYKEAYELLEGILETAKKSSSCYKGHVYVRLSAIYAKTNNDKKALKYNIESMKCAEELKKEQDIEKIIIMEEAYDVLLDIHRKEKNYEKIIDIYKKKVKLYPAKDRCHREKKAECYIEIGNALRERANTLEGQKKIDENYLKVIQCYKKAIKINKKPSQNQFDFGMASLHNHIGNAYLEISSIYQQREMYLERYTYVKKASKFFKKELKNRKNPKDKTDPYRLSPLGNLLVTNLYQRQYLALKISEKNMSTRQEIKCLKEYREIVKSSIIYLKEGILIKQQHEKLMASLEVKKDVVITDDKLNSSYDTLKDANSDLTKVVDGYLKKAKEYFETGDKSKKRLKQIRNYEKGLKLCKCALQLPEEIKDALITKIKCYTWCIKYGNILKRYQESIDYFEQIKKAFEPKNTKRNSMLVLLKPTVLSDSYMGIFNLKEAETAKKLLQDLRTNPVLFLEKLKQQIALCKKRKRKEPIRSRLRVIEFCEQICTNSINKEVEEACRKQMNLSVKEIELFYKKKNKMKGLAKWKVGCGGCGKGIIQCRKKKINLHLCSGCKTVYYCNKKCQKIGWLTHRNICTGKI